MLQAKTAYEMTDCDWSSDVCSSDLMRTMLGIGPKVHLVAPKTITRSEGKAVRVIDKRKLHD